MTAHYKFAWIMPDMFNPFWVYMRQGAEKAAQELRKEGIQVDIQQMAPIQTFNVEEQVAIFENAIQMKVDAIGICVIDQNAVIESINKAEAAGIPVAALSTDIPNSNRSVFAGQDNKVVAQKAAEMAIRKMVVRVTTSSCLVLPATTSPRNVMLVITQRLRPREQHSWISSRLTSTEKMACLSWRTCCRNMPLVRSRACSP